MFAIQIITVTIYILLYAFYFFNHFNICILTLLLHVYDKYPLLYFFYYLSEDGLKRPKHIGGLPHVCVLLYLIVVQLLEYIL
jgi:hypothetical protein